jgi:CcmD family protein
VKRAIKIIILFALITFATMWQTMSAGGPSQSCCTIAVPGLSVFAQETVTSAQVTLPETNGPAESSTVLYQVMAVILVIWLGLGLFLFQIDRRVARLEKSMSDQQGSCPR